MTFAGIPLWGFVTLALGCAGVLAVLHLLRVRPREVRVVTTLFWARAVEQTRARTLLHRFRHPLTYLLLLLICTLLSLALAQPEPVGQPPDLVHEVIIVDGGASMSAPDSATGGTRFDAARQAVSDEADRLALDDRLAVLVAAPLPEVVHAFDDPRALIERRLARRMPADVPAARDAALRLAASLLHGRSNPRIVLVTDRPLDAGPANELAPGVHLRVRRVGQPVDNAAILAVIFAPDADKPLRGSLYVRAGFWGAQPRDVSLRIDRGGGAPLLSETRRINPGGAQDFVISDLSADGDDLIVQLTPDDAVPADNAVRFRVPLRTPIRAQVHGPMPEALRVFAQTEPSTRFVAEGREHDLDILTSSPASDSSTPALVILPPGASVRASQPVEVVGESALVQNLDFAGAACGTGGVLGALPAGAEPLLVANGQVLAAASSVSAGPRCVYLSGALLADDATICRHPAFAVFLARALCFLAHWDADPVVLPPERSLADPLWAQRAGHAGAVVTAPGARAAADLRAAAPTNDDAPGPARWSKPAWFEIVLYVAFACFLIEAVLHTRGRIS